MSIQKSIFHLLDILRYVGEQGRLVDGQHACYLLILSYLWKFKIDDDFEFSKSFTHFFQIKAKNVSKKNSANGGESYPLITFTVAEKGGNRNEYWSLSFDCLADEDQHMFTAEIENGVVTNVSADG